MTKEEILKEVIKKAEKKNGWNLGYSFDNAEIFADNLTKELSFVWNKGTPGEQIQQLKDIIFNHEWAKAFFGKEWQTNLKEMVIEEDPLKYLEKFI